MANMYGTELADVQPVDNIVTAPAQSSSAATALESLASGVNAFSNRWHNEANSKRQAAADARAAQDQAWQAQDRAKKQTGEAVDNDVTVGVGLINGGGLGDSFASPQAAQYEQPAADPRVTADVTQAAKQVQNTDLAVQQGKLPPMSKTAQVDMLFNRLLVKYPDQAPAIAAQFKALGVDSALFDELKNEIDQRTAAQKADTEEFNKAVNYTLEHTDPKIVATMTPEERASHGFELMAQENQLDLQVKQAGLNAQINSTNQSQYSYTQKQISDQFGVTATNQAMTALQPIAQNMQKILLQLGEPGASPGLEAEYSDLLTRAKVAAGNIIQSQIAKGGYTSIDDANKARDFLTTYVQQTLISPYENRNKDFAAASQAFTTHLGFSAKVSAPVIYDLRTKFGISPSDIPGLLNSLPPDVMKGVQSEFQGIAKPGVNQNIATIHLSNILATLKGEKTLNNIGTPEERQQVVAGNYGYVLNNGPAVGKGQGNADMWMNGARNLVIASAGFSPATDIGTLSKAAAGMFNTGTVTALDRLNGQPETTQEAGILTQGMRASAAQVLSSVKRQIKGQNNAAWTIAVDGDGKYRVIPNKSWNPVNNNATYVAGVRAPTQATRPPVPSNYQQMVNTANMAQDFLIVTSKYDADAPKGTPREVRRMYSLGEPTAAMQKQQKQKAGSTASVESMIQSVRKDLENAPDLLQAPVGDNADIIGPEGTGRNPRSTAEGVGQFTEGTWKDVLQKHAPELIKGLSDDDISNLRKNKELARKAVGWYRSDNGQVLADAGLPATPENTALAHFAGAAGAISLLTADPNAPVEQVLGSDAITANPQLKGMTVGQAINWSHRFYRQG